MKKKQVFWGILVTVLALSFTLSGCASTSIGDNHYFSEPIEFGTKRGEESNSVVFGVFGSGYPRVDKVARENGITKIATIEHYKKPGFLFLSYRYTTIVTGE